MPRLARIDTPGVIHHVIIRRSGKDQHQTAYEDFIGRLGVLNLETQTRCCAWALMITQPAFSVSVVVYADRREG